MDRLYTEPKEMFFNSIKNIISACTNTKDLEICKQMIEYHYDQFKSMTMNEMLLQHYIEKEKELNKSL